MHDPLLLLSINFFIYLHVRQTCADPDGAIPERDMIICAISTMGAFGANALAAMLSNLIPNLFAVCFPFIVVAHLYAERKFIGKVKGGQIVTAVIFNVLCMYMLVEFFRCPSEIQS